MPGLMESLAAGAMSGFSNATQQNNAAEIGMLNRQTEFSIRELMEQRIADRNKGIEGEQHKRNRGEALTDQGTAQTNKLEQIDAQGKWRVKEHAAGRGSIERLSPAAQAQLSIASTSVASAQKEESLAARSYADAMKTGDPSVIKSSKDDWNSAKAGVAAANKYYSDVGKAHLGEEWKNIEGTKAPTFDDQYPVREKGANPPVAPNEKSGLATAPAPVAPSDQVVRANTESSAKASYEKANDELNKMKGPSFLPKNESAKRAIKAKQAEVDQLYNQIYK